MRKRFQAQKERKLVRSVKKFFNKVSLIDQFYNEEMMLELKCKKNKTTEVFNAKTRGSIKKVDTNGIKHHPPKKIKTVKTLIKIIEQYSAKKNKANPILEYSTLKPDTNSDSASGRSNGARFVSASMLIMNIKNSGKNGTTMKTNH